MVTKKSIKEGEIKKEAVKTERYFYAVGRRKTAIAKIKLFPAQGEDAGFTVNGRKLNEYFTVSRMMESAKEPLALAGEGLKFKAVVKVVGGGVNSQADAVKLGIARAMVLYDETLKKPLKDKGYLTRDSREVERKKPGLKKARKAPQWAKR